MAHISSAQRGIRSQSLNNGGPVSRLIRAYYRTRLFKIEKHAVHVVKEETNEFGEAVAAGAEVRHRLR